jgi:pimeloyl-ACP methyl ester carboxylesterase
MKIKSSFLNINNKQLEYLTYGNFSDNSPVLILLHEGLGSVAMWRQIPQLIYEKTNLNVIVYSRFGYGKSSNSELPRPLNYMTIEAEKYLPILIKKLKIKNYFLIGHSDGGTIAALGSRGKIINNLIGTVLLAPHFFIEGDNLKAIEKTRYQYEHGSLRLKLEKYHIDVDNAFYGWSNVWLDKNFKDWDITNHISEIKTPVLGIQGLNDPYGSIEQLNVILENIKVPFTKKTIKNCGHNPFHEYPEFTINCIDKFIKKLL